MLVIITLKNVVTLVYKKKLIESDENITIIATVDE